MAPSIEYVGGSTSAIGRVVRYIGRVGGGVSLGRPVINSEPFEALLKP